MIWLAGAAVRLLPIGPEHVQPLHQILNEPALAGRRYVPDDFPSTLPLSVRQVEGIVAKWLDEKKAATFAVSSLVDGELLGHATLGWWWDPHCPDASVVIAPRLWRHGFGRDAAGLLLRHAFESTPAHNVSSWMPEWDAEALAFAAALGFLPAGRVRRAGLRHGAFFDTIVVDILRPEWSARQGGDRRAARG